MAYGRVNAGALVVAILWMTGALLSLSSAGRACGTELWSLKVLSDAMAPTHFNPIWTTLGSLSSLPAPHPHNSRTTLERNTYQLRATLMSYRQEPDQDYHLVLADATQRSMIAEIPSPNCAPSPSLANIWRGLREQLDSRFGGGSATWTKANATVVLAGVLFFDVPHGQSGMAPNAVELHPVLQLKIER